MCICIYVGCSKIEAYIWDGEKKKLHIFFFFYSSYKHPTSPNDRRKLLKIRRDKQLGRLQSRNRRMALEVSKFTFFPESFLSHPIGRRRRRNRVRPMSGFRAWTSAGSLDFRVLRDSQVLITKQLESSFTTRDHRQGRKVCLCFSH